LEVSLKDEAPPLGDPTLLDCISQVALFPVEDYFLEDVLMLTGYNPPKIPRKKSLWWRKSAAAQTSKVDTLERFPIVG
jgi:hypothetical protein